MQTAASVGRTAAEVGTDQERDKPQNQPRSQSTGNERITERLRTLRFEVLTERCRIESRSQRIVSSETEFNRWKSLAIKKKRKKDEAGYARELYVGRAIGRTYWPMKTTVLRLQLSL